MTGTSTMKRITNMPTRGVEPMKYRKSLFVARLTQSMKGGMKIASKAPKWIMATVLRVFLVARSSAIPGFGSRTSSADLNERVDIGASDGNGCCGCGGRTPGAEVRLRKGTCVYWPESVNFFPHLRQNTASGMSLAPHSQRRLPLLLAALPETGKSVAGGAE